MVLAFVLQSVPLDSVALHASSFRSVFPCIRFCSIVGVLWACSCIPGCPVLAYTTFCTVGNIVYMFTLIASFGSLLSLVILALSSTSWMLIRVCAKVARSTMNALLDIKLHRWYCTWKVLSILNEPIFGDRNLQ